MHKKLVLLLQIVLVKYVGKFRWNILIELLKKGGCLIRRKQIDLFSYSSQQYLLRIFNIGKLLHKLLLNRGHICVSQQDVHISLLREVLLCHSKSSSGFWDVRFERHVFAVLYKSSWVLHVELSYT